MRNGELSIFLYSAARRLAHFFARNHRKKRYENNTKVQFRVSKVPKIEFQHHMPAKKSSHPARWQTHTLPTTTTTHFNDQKHGNSKVFQGWLLEIGAFTCKFDDFRGFEGFPIFGEQGFISFYETRSWKSNAEKMKCIRKSLEVSKNMEIPNVPKLI